MLRSTLQHSCAALASDHRILTTRIQFNSSRKHSTTVTQTAISASYYRGGTSRALIFKGSDLPADLATRKQIFLQAIGAPDIHGRQLNGLGAGVSSLSKVCIIDTDQSAADVDVLYTFAGIGIERDEVDFSGNCGNMASAVGPFAYNQRLLHKQHQHDSTLYDRDGSIQVTFVNTNTNTTIRSSFLVKSGQAQVDDDTVVDGVSGLGTGVKLDFLHPGGSKTEAMLPTGRQSQFLLDIEASCVDSATPCVFVRASDIGVDPTILPVDLSELHAIRKRLEDIRTAGAVAMGMINEGEEAPRVIPKIAVVAPAQDQRTLSGSVTPKESLDLVVRFISDTQPHRAIPLTGALCTATAAKIPGSIVHQCLSQTARADNTKSIKIGHPSGSIEVDAVLDMHGEVESASVIRTARRIFEGQIFYNA